MPPGQEQPGPDDNRRHDDQSGITIVRPPDRSIQPCGVPIVFRASVQAGKDAGQVTWGVTGDATFAAHGPAMRYTFAHTGVYQVVARVGSSVDDVLVYAYKTPSSRTTLADLRQAEPAPGAQRNDFKRYRVAPESTPEGNP